MTSNNQPTIEAEPVNRLAEVEEEAPKVRELQIEPPKPPLHVTLVPPVEYDGTSYNELTLDFDSMIGKDFHRIEKTFYKLYKEAKGEVVLPEMRHLYHNLVAADVANVPVGLIIKLPRRYYIAVRNESLKACGSSPDEEKA